MPTYDPTGHPLLSVEAAALSPEKLAAQADTAEAVLGRGSTYLRDTEFEAGSADYELARTAVAHQVNYQVESGIGAEVYGSQQRGGRQVGFRGGVLNPMPVVSPRAQAIVNRLIDATVSENDWPIARSVR
jgi:hypothetical protein